MLFVMLCSMGLGACARPTLLARQTAPLPTITPIPTPTPIPTATPIPTVTSFPSPTPAPYNATWQDISPPVSLDLNHPPNNYGMLALVNDPLAPATLYVGTCYQGLWKTTDGGAHWVKIDTGKNSSVLDKARLWTLAIDPVQPNILYTAAGYGGGGVWKSTDGGVDWQDTLPADVAQRYSGDVFSININPHNHLQLLIGFHSMPAGHNAVVLVSDDGGASWRALGEKVQWAGGEGHDGYFLSDTTYLVSTPQAGFWLSTDAGRTWKQVMKVNSTQYNQIYIAPSGAVFSGSAAGIVVSRDGGVTWQLVDFRQGYGAVIGLDGFLFAAAMVMQPQPTKYYVSFINDGTQWIPQRSPVLNYGPNSLAADPIHHVLYSSNWNGGVRKLVLQP